LKYWHGECGDEQHWKCVNGEYYIRDGTTVGVQAPNEEEIPCGMAKGYGKFVNWKGGPPKGGKGPPKGFHGIMWKQRPSGVGKGSGKVEKGIGAGKVIGKVEMAIDAGKVSGKGEKASGSGKASGKGEEASGKAKIEIDESLAFGGTSIGVGVSLS
jgi:hypothetical protein